MLANVRRHEKEFEDTESGKDEIKWFLFTDYMIVYIENPKEATKKS